MKNIWKAMIVLGILAYLFYPSGWDDFLGYIVGVALIVIVLISVINGTLVDSVKNILNWLKE